MYCEICGKRIVGRSYKVIVEGSELTVCESCRDLGVEAKKPVKIVIKPKIKVTKPIVDDYELAENFNEIIKREREKRGWTQEDLAKKIQEKVTLIKKIEKGEITPEKDVVEKLERVLGVSLREKIEDVKVEGSRSITPTLGDIVVIKRKRKND